MSFRSAIVLSVVFHLAVLAVVYFLPKPKASEEPPKAYVVRLQGPAEQAPEPASPPPAPRGTPEPTPPPRPSVPPAKPKTPSAATAPAPGPQEGQAGSAETPVAPGPSVPSGPEPSVTPSPGGRPGPPTIPRPSDIQDIIDRIAKAPTPSETKGAGITFDTQEFRYQAYMERLKEKIEGVWTYPRSAAEKGIYGDLVIQFTIRKDGSLASAKVVRTSGHQELDRAAVEALRKGEPYWPLPAGWEEDALTINGHFIYTLWGSYLR